MHWRALATAVLVASCSGTPKNPQVVSSDDGMVELEFDKSLIEGDKRLRTVWFNYAQAKGRAMMDAPEGQPPGQTAIVAELAGRNAAVEEWIQIGLRENPPDSDYLTVLERVHNKGFMTEYTLAFLAQPGWIIHKDTMAAMRLPGFTSWAGKDLKNHEPMTRASILKPAPPELEVPGRDIGGDIIDQPLGDLATRCPAIDGDLQAAIAEWEELADQAKWYPISARSRTEFADALMRPEVEVNVKMRGVVWVSPRIAEVFLLAARCRMEHGDYKAAEQLLIRLLTINPVNIDAATELAQVMLIVRRFADANSAVEGALILTGKKCEKSILWQTKAMIHLAQGDVQSAQRALEMATKLRPDDAALAQTLAQTKAAAAGEGEPPKSDATAGMALLKATRNICAGQ